MLKRNWLASLLMMLPASAMAIVLSSACDAPLAAASIMIRQSPTPIQHFDHTRILVTARAKGTRSSHVDYRRQSFYGEPRRTRSGDSQRRSVNLEIILITTCGAPERH